MSLVQVLSVGWGGSGQGDQRGLEEGPMKYRLPVPWQTGRRAVSSGERAGGDKKYSSQAGTAWGACMSQLGGVPAAAQPQPGLGCWSLRVN